MLWIPTGALEPGKFAYPTFYPEHSGSRHTSLNGRKVINEPKTRDNFDVMSWECHLGRMGGYGSEKYSLRMLTVWLMNGW
jgi:hypothetical protein